VALASCVLIALRANARRREKMPDQGQARIDRMSNDETQDARQLLHLVFGGELTDIESHTFRDPSKIDVVGIFPNYESAERAWRAKAQMTVDSAQTRYFIVHLHRFMEPTGLKRKLA
jgi:hypothetical protein